ncbi:MAG: hypothetical protein AAB969_00965, partial [Patescibacteria group bacterium]
FYLSAQLKKNVKDSDLDRALVIGDSNKTITNPRSISFSILMENDDEYQEIVKAKKTRMLGKISIYEARASERTIKLIEEYAKTIGIQSIFDEEPFFQFLRTMPDFKNKTDAELRKQFDITNDIIEYNKKKKEIKKEEKAEKKEENKEKPTKGFWEDISFPD